MPNDMVVLNCSPTLAGIKTANMFSVSVEDEATFRESICELNGMLVPRGIRMIPLRHCDGKALLYVYRPDRLANDLSDELATQILNQKKYPTKDHHQCVMELIRRLQREKDFPHEIGLFLGYPPEDVQGFIENDAKNAKYIGTWKVYGDVEKARRTFEQYKECTRAYWNSYRKHNSIDRLIVAVS